MTEPTPVAEFVRRFAADRDELVAARWWHEAMRHEVSAVPALADDTRRQI